MDIIQEAKEFIRTCKEAAKLAPQLWDAELSDKAIERADYMADLLSRLVDRLEELEEDNQVLRSCMRNAREVYIGMDGFKPETAPEGYCLWLLEQMYNELCDKPFPPVGDK